MGRPIVCNTCCPSDDPPPPTDCFGAIGVVFMDESSPPGASMSAKLEKYLRAFPDRLIFLMDVAELRNGVMDYNKYPQFVTSDRCYSLSLEHDKGLSIPKYIKRDGSGVVSDVYDYIVEIVTNSPKSTDEVREIWNTATEVSVFRDDSGSMRAVEVQNTYDKFNTDLVANNKFIVSSEINTNEDFVCPFVFEQCCINQDAADLLLECLGIECTPAELRFLTHPNSVYAIDKPCDSLLIDNTAAACDNCPPVRSFDHQVKYKAAVREDNGAILTHFDIDYYLQYRDSPDDNFVDLFDLPDAKSNIEQLFDVLLRNFMCGDAPAAAGGAVNNWELISIKEGEDIPGPLTPQGFGFCIDISGDGEYIVVGPQRPHWESDEGKLGKIVTFKRTVSGEGVVDYNLLNSFDVEDMEVVNSLTQYDIDADITITPDGKTMAFGCHGLGPAHPNSFIAADGSNAMNVGKTFVYDLNDADNWVQRGSAITWDDIGAGGSGGSVEISSDGNTLLVCPDRSEVFGPPHRTASVAARVFSWDGANWVQKGQDLVRPDLPDEPIITNQLQRWVFDTAMSDDGLVIALSEVVHNHRGLVRVYQYNAATSQWDIRHDFVGGQGQFIGSSVGMSKDGTRIAFSGHEGNAAVGSDPADRDSDKGDFIFNAYDWDGASYNAVGNTVKYARDNTQSINTGQGAQIDFADSKDLVAFGVQLDSGLKVVVLKLVADTWVQQGGDFLAGDDNSASFGSAASISRTGFTGAGKDFGHTLVFGDFLANNQEGKIYIYLSSQFGGGNPDPPDDDCEKVSCHPLISDMGNPPSSCDAYEDTDIGGDCTRRVFKREFRIRASNEGLTSVFSDPFKLYRYMSKKSVDEPNGEWVFIDDAVAQITNDASILKQDTLTLSFDADGEKIAISDSFTPSDKKGTVFTLIAEDQFNWKEFFTILQGSDNLQQVGLAQFTSDRELQNEWTPADSDEVLWKNSPSMVFLKDFNDSVRWMVAKDLRMQGPPQNEKPPVYIKDLEAPEDAVTWGDSIAIDGDGDTIVVGDRNGSGGKGCIYIYRWIYDDKSAREVRMIKEYSLGRHGSQKRQVKIDKSGQVVAWVEPYDSTRAQKAGRVVVLSHTGPSKLLLGDPIRAGDWRQRLIAGMDLKENNGPDLRIDLSADGNTIIISSVKGAVNTNESTERTGFAKVFQWDGTLYRKKGSTLKGVSTTDEFGKDCAISSDGNVIAISSKEEDPTNQLGIGANHGAVRCFFWNGTDWEQLGQTIRGDNGSAQLGFKLDLIVNPEGLKRLALSSNTAPNETKVKLYQFIPR